MIHPSEMYVATGCAEKGAETYVKIWKYSEGHTLSQRILYGLLAGVVLGLSLAMLTVVRTAAPSCLFDKLTLFLPWSRSIPKVEVYPDSSPYLPLSPFAPPGGTGGISGGSF
jgi:hypothetical protein